MAERSIPQLLHGMPIINPDGTPTKWFVDAWNDLLDRTGGQSVDLVGNIINGTQQLTDVNIGGASLSTTLTTINSNIDTVATEAAVGSGGLVVALSALFASASIVGGGVATTNAVAASASGGTGPYTYTLSKVTGDTISNVITGTSSEIVTFSETLSGDEYLTAEYRWTAQDSLGATGSKSFAVTLYSRVYSYGGSILP